MFLKFFGLNEQPFGVTPDPRFLYLGPAQQEAFSSLVYGIETGRGFMALIASPGLGKTTILLRLMERLRQSARTAFLFQMHTSSQEFLRSLIADLDIEPSGNDLGELQRQLGDVLIAEAKSGRRIVVAIDEAQNLDIGVLETVRMLSNFETPQAKLLQILLVGQPQLADKLALPQLEQLRQRVSIITHFPPLKGGDIPKYIDHRLRVAGYKGTGLFTPAALGLIGTYSKGIPRNINNLCFQALSLGCAKNQKKIDDVIMREVIADLSLESLGTVTSGASGKVPRTTHRPENLGAPPTAHDGNFRLDAVDLSSESGAGDYDTFGTGQGFFDRRAFVGSGRKGRNGLIAWVGLAGLLVGLCMWPWLRPGIDSWARFARDVALGPKSTEVTATPVTAPAVTNPKPAQTETPGDAPNQGNDSPGTTSIQQPAPDATTAPSDSEAPGDANPPVPGLRIASQQAPKRTNAPPREPGPVSETRYLPGSGRLVVESSVSGARISIDGESNPKWITPRLFNLAPGTYMVSVSRSGYDPWTKRIRVDEGREYYVSAELSDHDGGIFTVDTDPSGMQVFIDGKPYGPSRVDTVLMPGWHVCAVIPGPGLQALVSRFHLKSGEALTRRIRMGVPAGSSENNMQQDRGQGVTTAAVPHGGTP